MLKLAPKTETELLKWFPVASSLIMLIFTLGIAIGGYTTFAKAAEAIPKIQTDVEVIKIRLDGFKERLDRADAKAEKNK